MAIFDLDEDGPRYDDKIYKARDRFVRMVGLPILRNIARPSRDVPLDKLKWKLAERLSQEPILAWRLDASFDMNTLFCFLLFKAPVPLSSLHKSFPVNEIHPLDLLHCEYAAFEYLGYELARKCIANDAVLCFAEDAGHYTPVSDELFGEAGEDALFSLPPAKDPITGQEVAEYYLEEVGADRLIFVFYENVQKYFAPANNTANSPLQNANPSATHGRRPRGYAHLDRPYVEEALKLLRGNDVASSREAAHVVAERLYKRRDEFPGKYPGSSFEAVMERLYKRLLELVDAGEGSDMKGS